MRSASSSTDAMNSRSPVRQTGMAFNPYLNFGGNCAAAFTRYQEIFGGELVLLPMSSMPPSEEPAPADKAGLIIHAALKFHDHLLMASDTFDTEGFGPVQGMYVSYNTDDPNEAKRVFEALVEGGEVEMPLAETFFSPMFGVCRDRFGTPWMVSTDAAETA